MELDISTSLLLEALSPIATRREDLTIVDRTIFSAFLRQLKHEEVQHFILESPTIRSTATSVRVSNRMAEFRKKHDITQGQLATELQRFGLRLKQEDVSALERKSTWGKFSLERLIQIDIALRSLDLTKTQAPKDRTPPA